MPRASSVLLRFLNFISKQDFNTTLVLLHEDPASSSGINNLNRLNIRALYEDRNVACTMATKNLKVLQKACGFLFEALWQSNGAKYEFSVGKIGHQPVQVTHKLLIKKLAANIKTRLEDYVGWKRKLL